VADFFAGCLLMPKSQLKKLYYQGMQLPAELGKQFGTSVKAIQCRLRQTGIAEKPKDCANWHTNRTNVRYNQPASLGVSV
jgi:Zn-dependent peptidase ImmA (M78 family)